MNIDGAFKEDKGGIGVVIRDSKGELIATMAEPINKVVEPKLLEALAVAKGIDFANDLALTGYSLEMDCLEVVNRVNNTDEDLSVIGHLVETIRQNIKNPCCLGLSYSRRCSNVPTHSLAKFACNLIDCRV